MNIALKICFRKKCEDKKDMFTDKKTPQNSVFYSFTDSNRTYSISTYVPTAAKDITFQTLAGDKTLPANLAAGETHVLQKSFTMPFGSVTLDYFFAGTLA